MATLFPERFLGMHQSLHRFFAVFPLPERSEQGVTLGFVERKKQLEMQLLWHPLYEHGLDL